MPSNRFRKMPSGFALGGLLVVTLLSAGPASAARRWDAGLRGGLNVAGLYGSDADTLGTSSRKGFTGGAWGTGWLNEAVGIRLEALYSQKGATEDSVTASLDYIDVPLLIVFRREITEGRTYLMMEAGPVFSFKVGADINNGNDLDATTSDFDFSGAIGLALAHQIGFRLDIVGNVRYTVGFVSIDKSSDLDYRNYSLAFTVGVQRRFGYW